MQVSADFNSLKTSVAWIEGAALGTFATTTAVVGIATVGLLMLTGRIDARRFAKAILGCFIIFEASLIAHALSGAFSQGRRDIKAVSTLPPPAIVPQPITSSAEYAGPFDPYAGAASPQR